MYVCMYLLIFHCICHITSKQLSIQMLIKLKTLFVILLLKIISCISLNDNSPVLSSSQLEYLGHPFIELQKINRLMSESNSYSETGSTKTKPQKKCQCLNEGKCTLLNQEEEQSDKLRNYYCDCTRFHIGRKCQQQAQQISSNKQIFKFLNIYKYKYFYYQPTEEDMLSFTFHLCFDTRTHQNNSNQSPQLQNSMTFFLRTQNQNGDLKLSEKANHPTTIELGQNQCKYITVDFTMFIKTRYKSVEKMVFAIKLGQRIHPQRNDSIDQDDQDDQDDQSKSQNGNDPQKPQKKLKKSDRAFKYSIQSVANDKNFLSHNTSNYSSNYSSSFNQKSVSSSNSSQNIQTGPKRYNGSAFRRVYFNFVIKPLTVEEMFKNIVYSLVTIAAFITMAILIFFLRTRILGIQFTESLSQQSGLANDLKHFQTYLPSEQYVRDQQNQGSYPYQSDQEVECSICIASLEHGQAIRRTPCDHVFHKGCIDAWCLQNLTCPICRRSLTQNKVKEYFSTSMELRTNSDSND